MKLDRVCLPGVAGVALAVLMPGMAPVQAAEPAGLGEEAFFAELPVVVSVTRLPQNYLDVPASVTVIDRQMIEASGAVDIPNLLRLAAGFQVGHATGNRTTVTYHGMSDEYARRMQVLVDGRSVYMPATGGVDWVDLPLAIEDIERIEVTRGPNGVTFGANSFLGVINIITLHPGTTQGTLVKVATGDGQYRKALVRQGGRYGDLDYRLTFEHRSDMGLDDTQLGNTWYRWKDDELSNRVTFRGEYRPATNDYLGLQFGVNSGDRGDGNPDDLTTPPHTNQNWSHYQQFKWKRVISSDQEFELQFYHNYSDTDAWYQTALLSDVFGYPPAVVAATFGVPDQRATIDHNSLSERYDAEFQHRFRLTPDLRIVWGGEVRLDRVISAGFIGRSDAIENHLSRFFAHGEWRPRPDWVVNAGAMVEQNDITGTQVSPRLAINRHLGKHHALRFSYTTAYRTPAIYEEYADYAARFELNNAVVDQLWKSAGGLKPERITAYELGLVGDINSKVQYDLKLFHEEMRDLISTPVDRNFAEPYSALCGVLGPSGFCWATVFNNTGRADLDGFEAQLKLRSSPDELFALGFSHVVPSGQLQKDLNFPGTTYVDLELATPSYTVSVLMDKRWPSGWQSSLALYHVTAMQFMGGSETSYATASWRLARQFAVGTTKGKAALVFHDFGGEYFDFTDTIVTEPRAYFSLEFQI